MKSSSSRLLLMWPYRLLYSCTMTFLLSWCVRNFNWRSRLGGLSVVFSIAEIFEKSPHTAGGAHCNTHFLWTQSLSFPLLLLYLWIFQNVTATVPQCFVHSCMLSVEKQNSVCNSMVSHAHSQVKFTISGFSRTSVHLKQTYNLFEVYWGFKTPPPRWTKQTPSLVLHTLASS